MKKQWIFFIAAMTAVSITACGGGDGITINGTTAAEAGSDVTEAKETPEETSQQQEGVPETSSGTRIEIITGETTEAETAESTESEAEQSGSGQSSQNSGQSSQGSGQSSAGASSQQSGSSGQSSSGSSGSSGTTQSSSTAATQTYKVNDIKKTMYATASVRVRSSYSTSSEVIAGLKNGEKIEVTGESENGWMRVNYNGHVGYVAKSYLTETPPATTAEASGQTGSTSSGTSSGSQSGTSSSSGSTGSSQTSKPTTTTGSSQTPGSTSTAAGPSGGSTTGSATGPGGGTGSTGSSGATAPGGTSSPGSSSSSGTSASSGNTVTGNIISMDPSGVTIQSTNGTSYQFVWGNEVPALAPGDKVSISYETTGSGERRVTGISK